MEKNVPAIPEISLYTYIASKRNPVKQDRAIRFVMSKGYDKPKNRYELAKMLHDYVVKSADPERALREMVNEIHPDKELFTIEIKRKEEKQNACGCSMPMNADGAPATQTQTQQNHPVISERLVNTLIISGVILIGVSILVTVGVSIAKSR